MKKAVLHLRFESSLNDFSIPFTQETNRTQCIEQQIIYKMRQMTRAGGFLHQNGTWIPYHTLTEGKIQEIE